MYSRLYELGGEAKGERAANPAPLSRTNRRGSMWPAIPQVNSFSCWRTMPSFSAADGLHAGYRRQCARATASKSNIVTEI
jgi:hypothetical protein